MAWTVDLMALDGSSTVHSAVHFLTCKVTWALDADGAVELDLARADALTGWWRGGQYRVAVRNPAGTRVFQGWLEHLERQGSPSDYTFKAAGRGLAAILSRRFIHGDFSQVAVVATTAAQAILTHIDGQTNDATGFTLGTVTGTAPSVTRYFCDGDEARAAIDELAMHFAWEIDADGHFNAWVGGRGTDRSGTYTLSPSMGGASDITGWDFTEDSTEVATYVTGLGDSQDDGPCGPPLVVDFTGNSTLMTQYKRVEAVISDPTEDVTEMTNKTTEEIRARLAARWALKTTWVDGRGPWAFGTVGLGDIVGVQPGAEFGGGTVNMRCTSISLTLEPTPAAGPTFVEMTWEAV
jgi:hypothetical protein